MTLEIYIGYISYMRTYYINRHGQDTIDKNAKQFKEIEQLLNYLTSEHKQRKAFVKIGDEIQPDIKERILNHIKTKIKKLEVLVS